MWLAIWGIFAVFIFGFVIWTMAVLYQQKRAWSAFAKRHKLKYDAGTFMGSPTVTGKIKDRLLSLYTGIQQTDDIRGQRFVTVIEFQLGDGMPTGAAISTPQFRSFIDGLIFDETYQPELAEWDKDYVVRTRDEKNLSAYLTKERQQVLHSLFTMKTASVLFFFDELEAVLRVETSDPLRSEAHLNAIIKRLADAAETLSPSKTEKVEFKKLLQEEKTRYHNPPAEQAAPKDSGAAVEEDEIDLEGLDLEDLGIDEDDDEEEIIIIKKKRSKKKTATADASGNKKAASSKKKPAAGKKKT